MSHARLIARETAVSAVVNAVLSLLFFLAVFGMGRPVAIPAIGLDTLPQTFMVALMASLVPGLIVGRRLARPAAPIVLRAFGFALVSLAVLGGGALMLSAGRDGSVPAAPALIAKIAYGAALGAVIIPIAVAIVLRKEI